MGMKTTKTKGFTKGTNTMTSYDKNRPSFKLEHKLQKPKTKTQIVQDASPTRTLL
jgi:hypothetical protein